MTVGASSPSPNHGAVRPDLDDRDEIRHLVLTFYRDVAIDPLLGPVFIDVAEVDWTEHIPKLVDFWCRVLLGEPCYAGAVLAAHQEVHERQAFGLDLFDRWYGMFVDTVDDGWEGPYAEAAKDHAARIAATLARRIVGEAWAPPDGHPVAPLDPAAGAWLTVPAPARRP